MRDQPTVLHLDLDAFFAAVEQRDKPSLRGKPVIVGGIGPRGVVATASYEARPFGVGSAMSMAQARALCPNAAFLAGRFSAYREVSTIVMDTLGRLSEVCEPISLDECFVDLAAAGDRWDTGRVRAVAAELKAAVHAGTGLRASVGAGTSKLVAKIASDLDKPDGLRVVPPGAELELIGPMPVRRIWSVGPATEARLRQIGVHTVTDLGTVGEDDLVALLGGAHGRLLAQLARAEDTRPVTAHREAKSVSVEDTFERDLVDRATLAAVVDRMAAVVTARLRESGLSARTVTLKARKPDFSTLTRSATLPGPTDDGRAVGAAARRLLAAVDTTDGLRLLGVGVSGLTDWTQEDLFDLAPEPAAEGSAEPAEPPADERPTRWVPGQDVHHRRLGAGWVWGSGLGRVTVRFETRESTEPGPVRTFAVDDPELGVTRA
ncbi:MAG TPA: DNA polymerase IV [Sporichthyaceae bacterium]|jgi:DNA polymerase-4|nr:DNA polymerase IV [Sporichthyaceae bacterium]